jgi:hypothetical protein
MSEHYTLIGQTAVEEPDLLTWARSFEEDDRIVKQEDVGNVWVSTVFLGIDHSFNGGPPLLFETMAFYGRGGHDLLQYRCSTWAEAEAQHEGAVQEAGEPGFQLRAIVTGVRDWWADFKHYCYWLVWPNHKGNCFGTCVQCWEIRRRLPEFFEDR